MTAPESYVREAIKLRLADLLIDWGPKDPPIPLSLFLALVDLTVEGRGWEDVFNVVEKSVAAGDEFPITFDRTKPEATAKALEWFEDKKRMVARGGELAERAMAGEELLAEPDAGGIRSVFRG